MKKASVVVAALVFLVLLGLAARNLRDEYKSRSLAANRPANPVWVWSQQNSESFVLQPGQGRIGYEVSPGSARQKVAISASSPVMIAYFPAGFRQQMISNPQGTLQQSIFLCVQHQMTATSYECDLPAGGTYDLVIHDERTGQDLLAAGAAAVLGMRDATEKALVSNNVTVAVLVWQCIRNCAGQSPGGLKYPGQQ